MEINLRNGRSGCDGDVGDAGDTSEDGETGGEEARASSEKYSARRLPLDMSALKVVIGNRGVL